MKHDVFVICKLFPKIIFIENKIFYVAVHTKSVSITANDYFVRSKVLHNIHDCFVENRNLHSNIYIINHHCQ